MVNNYTSKDTNESSSKYMNDLPTIYETIPYTGYPLNPFRSKGVPQTLSSTSGGNGYFVQFRFNEDGEWKEQNDYNTFLVDMGSYDIYYRVYYVDYKGNTVYYQPELIGTTTVTIGKAVPFKGWLNSMGPITYDGEEHVLFEGRASSLPKTGTIYYYAHTSGTSKPNITGEIKDVFDTDINNLKGTEEGTYYLWCWIEGNDYFEASDITYMGVSTVIAKPTGYLKTGTLQASNSIEPYNGSEQQLFTGAAIGPDECSNHRILYYAGTTEPNPYTIGYLNIADIKESDAGVYMLYYRMHSCDNYADIPWTYTGIQATINKGVPVFNKDTLTGVETTYTSNNISVFDGSGKITTGEGTIYYCCTTGNRPDDSVIGYENIQAVTVKTPGTYSLWYRIEGPNYEIGWTLVEEVESVVTKRDSNSNSKSLVDYVPMFAVIGVGAVLLLVCAKLGKRRY